MIIFDFDKTLINKDTLFGFYKIVHGDNFLFKIKRIQLLIGAVLYKLKIIDNESLKGLGIKLFLKGKTKSQLEQASIKYAKQLKLNTLYDEVYLNTSKEERLIISASPEIYLKCVFPGEKVLGTLLAYKNERVDKLQFNCYGKSKVSRFKNEYPGKQIEKVYSDSLTDQPLFDIAKQYYLIENGSISLKTV